MNGPDPIEEISSRIKLARSLAKKAEAELRQAIPTLQRATNSNSGQGHRVKSITLSVWNDHHQVNLCDALSSLDADLAQAVVALIAARAHLGGDADNIIRPLIK